MDIKKEEDDELLSSENTYHGYYLNQYNLNGDLSPDIATVKLEAFVKDEHHKTKEENLLLDSYNIKQENEEEEDSAWLNQEVEITYDFSPFKIENVEKDECLNRQTTLDQVTAAHNIREPFVHSSPTKSAVLFDDKQFKKNNIKKEFLTSQPIVVVINLERISFFDSNFVCNVCMGVFSSPFALQTHQKDNNNLCKDANKTMNSSIDNNSLFKEVTVKKRFKCDRCNYTCARKYALKNHNYSHTGLKPLKCDQCYFRCVQNSELLQHKLSHSGEKRFKCNRCEFKCTRKHHLNYHMSIHNTEKPFKCDICEFKSAWETSLRRHKLSHITVEKFKCDKCNFTSVFKSSLSQHRLYHTGKKLFECNICEFKSALKSHLDYHVLIHTDEKTFICDICDFKTVRNVVFQRHKLSHTGERPYKCDKCNFASLFRFNLKEHMISHTGEKNLMHLTSLETQ